MAQNETLEWKEGLPDSGYRGEGLLLTDYTGTPKNEQLAPPTIDPAEAAMAINAGLEDEPYTPISTAPKPKEQPLPDTSKERINADIAGNARAEFESYASGKHFEGKLSRSVEDKRQQLFAKEVLANMKERGINWEDLTEGEMTVIARSSRRAAKKMSIFGDEKFNENLDKLLNETETRKKKNAYTDEAQQALNTEGLADNELARQTAALTDETKNLARELNINSEEAMTELARREILQKEMQEAIDSGDLALGARKKREADLAQSKAIIRQNNNTEEVNDAQLKAAQAEAELAYTQAVTEDTKLKSERPYVDAYSAFMANPDDQEAIDEFYKQAQTKLQVAETINIIEGKDDIKLQSQLSGVQNQYRLMVNGIQNINENKQSQLKNLEEEGLDPQAYEDRRKMIETDASQAIAKLNDVASKMAVRMDSLETEIKADGSTKLKKWWKEQQTITDSKTVVTGDNVTPVLDDSVTPVLPEAPAASAEDALPEVPQRTETTEYANRVTAASTKMATVLETMNPDALVKLNDLGSLLPKGFKNVSPGKLRQYGLDAADGALYEISKKLDTIKKQREEYTKSGLKVPSSIATKYESLMQANLWLSAQIKKAGTKRK